MKGILFKDEMVRAICNTLPDVWPAQPIDAGLPCKWQTRRRVNPQPMPNTNRAIPSYLCIEEKLKYRVGEIIYVKEVFVRRGLVVFYRSDYNGEFQPGWKSSLIMPASDARLWLKVMGAHVERVHEILPADCLAEGVRSRSEYEELYNSINGPGSFDRDWCFVYTFQRVSKPSKGKD